MLENGGWDLIQRLINATSRKTKAFSLSSSIVKFNIGYFY
jgi:hypothetical protein